MDKTMTDTLNWIYTKDHRPTFEECDFKIVVYHREGWGDLAVDALPIRNKHNYSGVFCGRADEELPPADRYVILSITIPDPEPVPCKVCGMDVECIHDPAYTGDPNPYVLSCDGANHNVSFDAPTRAEAIQLWNKWNGG